MNISKRTIVQMLNILDNQLVHAKAYDNAKSKAAECQLAYYDGMKTAVEFMLTEGYFSHSFIDIDKDGKHFLVNR